MLEGVWKASGPTPLIEFRVGDTKAQGKNLLTHLSTKVTSRIWTSIQVL